MNMFAHKHVDTSFLSHDKSSSGEATAGDHSYRLHDFKVVDKVVKHMV